MIITNSTLIDVIKGSPISNIRGGGTGNYGAYIAKITGTDTTYGFARTFCKKNTSTVSRSGRSGMIVFDATEPGVYEYKKLGSFKVSSNREIAGFFVIDAEGAMFDITKDEVLTYVAKFTETA